LVLRLSDGVLTLTSFFSNSNLIPSKPGETFFLFLMMMIVLDTI